MSSDLAPGMSCAIGTDSAGDAAGCGARDDICHLCGDEAVVGQVLSVNESARTASVSFTNGVAIVALDLVDAAVGDRLLVHLGFAIARLEHA